MPFLKTMVGVVTVALVIMTVMVVFRAKSAKAESTIVQVMSVNNQTAAAAEVERLLAQGVPSFQRAEEVSGIGLRYRVYLGPFDSAGEAKGAAEALKSSGLIKEYIVRTDSAANAPPVQAQSPPVSQESWPQPLAQPSVQDQTVPNSQDYWPPPPAQPSAQSPPVSQESWPQPLAQPSVQAQTAPNSQDYWPPPPTQPSAQSPPASQESWPPLPGQTSTQAPMPPGEPALAPSAMGAAQQGPPVVPVLPPAQGVPQAPGEPALAPSAMGAAQQGPPPGVPVLPPAQAGGQRVIPAKPTGPMKIQGFELLTDLSSSMRRLSVCSGGLVKQEAVNTLLRKMNHRIPSQPYTAAMRVFGYKQAWTRSDYTTLYFGPSTYDRAAMEDAIGRLFAADSISPFGFALTSSESELAVMNNPKAVLMFADFEETTDSGAPVDKAKSIRRKYGDETKIYTFYVTRQTTAERLAGNIAKAGGGKDYNVCELLGSDAAFEDMMNEIFGPADIPPCKDSDGDGVCDEKDLCPSTPDGAPVDERGCWIAAYSQFFDFDKADVKAAFHPRLKFAAEIIVKNPQMGTVTIAGHTDNKGTDAYNMDLGRRRAEAVKELLVKFGAPADRLTVESYGKSRPIATNDTEEGRAKNRRVEFHVGDVPK